MNLTLQTRRAVITLSLMALAMVCVAAKATRTDAVLSAGAPAHVESVARASLEMSAGSVTVRIAEPAVVTIKTKAIARCQSNVVRI